MRDAEREWLRAEGERGAEERSREAWRKAQEAQERVAMARLRVERERRAEERARSVEEKEREVAKRAGMRQERMARERLAEMGIGERRERCGGVRGT